MNRKGFTDSRGDEYIFIRYNTNQIRLTKLTKSAGSGKLVHQIELSAEAMEELEQFAFKEAAD